MVAIAVDVARGFDRKPEVGGGRGAIERCGGHARHADGAARVHRRAAARAGVRRRAHRDLAVGIAIEAGNDREAVAEADRGGAHERGAGGAGKPGRAAVEDVHPAEAVRAGHRHVVVAIAVHVGAAGHAEPAEVHARGAGERGAGGAGEPARGAAVEIGRAGVSRHLVGADDDVVVPIAVHIAGGGEGVAEGAGGGRAGERGAGGAQHRVHVDRVDRAAIIDLHPQALLTLQEAGRQRATGGVPRSEAVVSPDLAGVVEQLDRVGFEVEHLAIQRETELQRAVAGQGFVERPPVLQAIGRAGEPLQRGAAGVFQSLRGFAVGERQAGHAGAHPRRGFGQHLPPLAAHGSEREGKPALSGDQVGAVGLEPCVHSLRRDFDRRPRGGQVDPVRRRIQPRPNRARPIVTRGFGRRARREEEEQGGSKAHGPCYHYWIRTGIRRSSTDSPSRTARTTRPPAPAAPLALGVIVATHSR